MLILRGGTWRIIPVSKWLITPRYKPFRPFGRGTTPFRRLTNYGYEPLTNWYDPPNRGPPFVTISRGETPQGKFTGYVGFLERNTVIKISLEFQPQEKTGKILGKNGDVLLETSNVTQEKRLLEKTVDVFVFSHVFSEVKTQG